MNSPANPISIDPAPVPIRVAVADASTFVRNTLGWLIETDRAMLLTATARNLDELIQKTADQPLDVMVLSTRLLAMSIRELLSCMKTTSSHVPAILTCSPANSSGGHEALQALAEGAMGVMALDATTLSGHLSDLRAELLRKVRLLAAPRIARTNLADSRPIVFPGRGVHLIAIGASDGAFPVLERILTQIPPQLPCPIVIAQHLPAVFSKALAERLDGVCAISVVHGEQGMPLHPGSAYIIPGTHNGRVRAIGPGPIRLELAQSQDASQGRPSVNELFTSAARQCARHTLGVVLSGADEDVRRGTGEILNALGAAVALDPAASAFPAMPDAAITSGATPMSPEHIAATIASLAAGSCRRAA